MTNNYIKIDTCSASTLPHGISVDSGPDISGRAGDGADHVGGLAHAAGVDGTDAELVRFTLDLMIQERMKDVVCVARRINEN